MMRLFEIRLIIASIAALIFYSASWPLPIHGQSILAETPSHMESTHLLVVEAEDLGMAHSVDKASFSALEKG